MTLLQKTRLFLLGGVCGIAGTLCYILAAVVPLGQTMTYVLAVSWPVLSVIFVFSLFQYIGMNRQSPANQLAFVFASLAFSMVASMISIQLAVRVGLEEYFANAPQSEEFLKLIRSSVRLVDMGLDVAWDVFIGVSLMFLCVALFKHDRFGPWWAVPSGLLGLLLIVLNIITFPWPPGTQGLFDIGPVVGLFIIALSVRLLMLGSQVHQ